MTEPVKVTVTSTVDHEDVVVGTATFGVDGKATSFFYDGEYLANPKAYAIDPALPLDYAPHRSPELPLALQDAGPDHWGKQLLQRQRDADRFGGKKLPIRMTEADLLLGAGDTTRQGALRFSIDDGPYLQPRVKVPKQVKLSELLNAAEQVDADDTDKDWQAAVKTMLDAGTGALGGALPKAAILHNGDLWLAKFPRVTDKYDRSVWEKTALDLAEQAGIPTPDRQLVRVGPKTVLLVKRFDRVGDERVPYISARTLMQANDAVNADYRDMADALRYAGSAVNEDLDVLYRQIALGAMIHNTDNHLRNHGFLRDGAGWRVSPAFDMNPNPQTGDARAVSAAGSSLPYNTAAGLLKVAKHCGLKKSQAIGVLDEVASVVETWRDVAQSNGATDRELDKFTDALTTTTTNVRQALPAPTRVRTDAPRVASEQPREDDGTYGFKQQARPDRGLE